MNTDPQQVQIHSRTPVRIDLAGGTVDIWPLFLFLKRPTTINIGVDLHAETHLTITPSNDPNLRGTALLRSKDQNVELRVPFRNLSDASVPSTLLLHQKLLNHFLEFREVSDQMELILSTRAQSPAGAGLGGSSALSISIIGALESWVKGCKPIEPLVDGDRLITIARDIETRILGVPAGLQDYFGAMYGGLQSIAWDVSSHRRKWFPENTLREVEKRLLVFYSGQSRNSGINNWILFKSLIDRDLGTRNKFDGIVEATHALEDSLNRQDWKQAAHAIADEWKIRKTLADGISIAETDQAFSIAERHGIRSVKICGAGGGGCFFVFTPDPDPKLRSVLINEIISIPGIRSLPIQAVSQGLDVQIES